MRSNSHRPQRVTHLFFAVILSLIVLVPFMPFIVHPASRMTDDSDGMYTVWDMWRVQDNILKGRLLVDGNIFYPHRNTIVFSDDFIVSAIFSFPVRLFTQEPVVLFTFTLLSGEVLTALAVYWLLSQVTDKKQLAFIGAILFTLSPIHVSYSGHLHVFCLQYVVGAIAALLTFYNSGKSKWLWLSMLLTVFQVWNSLFLVYYVILFGMFSVLVPGWRSQLLRSWKTILLIAVVGLVLCSPILWWYLQFSHQYHAVRDIREAIHFSLQFEDLTKQFWSPVLYGVAILTAFIAACRKSTKRDPLVRLCAIVALGAFVLSLGPALHWAGNTVRLPLLGHRLHIPLPWAVLYYIAPGFKAFRTPSRFMPLVAIALVSGAIRVLSCIPFKRWVVMEGGGIVIALALLWRPPIPVTVVPVRAAYPTYVRWLVNRPEQVIAVMPVNDWASPHAKDDLYAMLYSTLHGKTLLNGQSGYFPDEWMNMQWILQTHFPDMVSIQLLRERGVQLLVIPNRSYSLDLHRTIQSLIGTPLYADGQDSIYSL